MFENILSGRIFARKMKILRNTVFFCEKHNFLLKAKQIKIFIKKFAYIMQTQFLLQADCILMVRYSLLQAFAF